MKTLRDMQLPVNIWTMPVEVADRSASPRTARTRPYDKAPVEAFWRILARWRAGLFARALPVHRQGEAPCFFLGSFDLAVTRFSGRPAPPREGPAFMRDAYSHEVISHGFWPGSGPERCSTRPG